MDNGLGLQRATHGNREMETVLDARLDATAIALPEKQAVQERSWGFAARIDENVTFEEYTYWAKIEREMEAEEERVFHAKHGKTPLLNLIKRKVSKAGRLAQKQASDDRAMQLQTVTEAGAKGAGLGDEKNPVTNVTSRSPTRSEDNPLKVYDAEWRLAARALRTASCGQMFFLITTDILGWSDVLLDHHRYPGLVGCSMQESLADDEFRFVFASVGYGPGVALYVIFGAFASLSGYAIWKVFLELDSSRYPMLSFGDPFFRLFGKRTRHFINVAQSIQQFLTVAVLVLSKSLNISQLAHDRICFSAVMIIVMGIGMLSGLIRSLRKIGWLSQASVWMNITSFLIIMSAAATHDPYYPAVIKSTLIKTIEPIRTFAGTPPSHFQQQSLGFSSQFNAVNTMVYAYAGALLFVAFLAEMRNPMDFWKGLFCAQAFICTVYLFFGVFVYSYYGQYSASTIVNVIQPRNLQSVGNVLHLLTGFIAVFMYFNIGMKTVYLEVFQEVFHFPPITTKKGKILWYCLGPVYWILAFLIAAAVPNINGIVSFVGALFMINFTYSFPACIYLGWKVQKASQLPGEGFDPATRITTRHDNGLKRWIRGYKKTMISSTITTIYILAGFACCGMGTWAAIEGLITQFGPGATVATSFGCPAPV